jgi:hypothetical protein
MFGGIFGKKKVKVKFDNMDEALKTTENVEFDIQLTTRDTRNILEFVDYSLAYQNSTALDQLVAKGLISRLDLCKIIACSQREMSFSQSAFQTHAALLTQDERESLKSTITSGSVTFRANTFQANISFASFIPSINASINTPQPAKVDSPQDIKPSNPAPAVEDPIIPAQETKVIDTPQPTQVDSPITLMVDDTIIPAQDTATIDTPKPTPVDLPQGMQPSNPTPVVDEAKVQPNRNSKEDREALIQSYLDNDDLLLVGREGVLKYAIATNNIELINAFGSEIKSMKLGVKMVDNSTGESHPKTLTPLQYAMLSHSADQKSVAALILNGDHSPIVGNDNLLLKENLEIRSVEDPKRDAKIAIVAQDQALRSGFESIKSQLKGIKNLLGINDISNDEMVDIIRAAIYADNGEISQYRNSLNNEDKKELNEFRDAMSLTYFQEFVADFIGIFSDMARDQYRLEILTEQLTDLFKEKIVSAVESDLSQSLDKSKTVDNKDPDQKSFVDRLKDAKAAKSGPEQEQGGRSV